MRMPRLNIFQVIASYVVFLSLLMGLIVLSGCDTTETVGSSHPAADRNARLPADIVKRSPETDPYPPVMYSQDFEQPIPLPLAVNSSGAEDSPFILPDGKTLYFFFTPDVRIPVEKQLLDGVTGLWVTHRIGGAWSDPEKVWLQKSGKLSMDGAICIQGDEMWFASAREGYTGVNIFIAELINGKWDRIKYAGDRLMKEIQIGELHIRGNELYFHSARPGGKGDYDIWVTEKDGDKWSDPVNIEIVNTDAMDGFPYVSSDGSSLWFTRTYKGTPAILKSVKKNGLWSEPELIVSQFAGEPTLDDEGNLYFIHHYYENNVMIEADIYVAYKK